MADCINEITGVQIISLYPSDSVRLVRPDISNENEVNLISDGEDSYIISDPVLLPKWERVVGYSGNYKQNYLDEFTFLAFGIENEIPAIIKELRNTRVGYVAEIKTIGDSNYVFQSPVFLNNANTKQIDSHSWQISLSYRIPSFLDKLTNLATILGTDPEVLPCDKEIQGIKSISLYVNENVEYLYLDISNENEIALVSPEDPYLTIDQVKQLPKWERIINYSENYKQNYNDEFTFLLHGIENDVPETIKTLRNNRLGYIAVITTTSNKNYIFQTPIFLNENNTKQVDSHSWAVSLAYRVPSFDDKLTLVDTPIIIPKILITMDMSTPSTAGILLDFASGNLWIDWKEGGGLVPFVNGIELTHTYSTPGTYIAEITGDHINITTFVADNSKITFIEDFITGLLVEYSIFSNLYAGIIDLSKSPVSVEVLTYFNSGATAIIFADSGNSLVQNMNIPACGFTSLDFTNVPLIGLFHCWQNFGLTNVTFASSGNGNMANFRLDSCNFDYVDFTNMAFAVINGRVWLQNNSMAVADVNHILVDLYSLVSGEGVGGDYTGRTIRIDGTNAAPDGSSGGFDGDQAVIDLTAKGITVTTT